MLRSAAPPPVPSRRPFSAAVGLALLWVLAGCSGSPGGAPQRGGASAPVPVTVGQAAEKDVPVRLRAIGTVEAAQTVTLKPQVNGELAQVHFREGQTVARGDLLFTIDPRPFEAALRQAQANLARSVAEANNAEIEAVRLRKLLGQSAVSKEEADQAETRLAMLRATVRADEAAVETARLQLDYCSIRAPIGGRIGRAEVDAGNTVRARNTTLAVLHQTRPIDVLFSVPERRLPEIRRRAAEHPLAAVALVAGHGGPAPAGTVTFVDNAVDKTTGTIALKASFANEDELLWPGQFVDVEVTLGTLSRVVVVPATAVQSGQQGEYVFAVGADAAVERRPVRTGYSAGGETVVLEGVRPADTVVTDGHLRLAPGSKVDVRNAPAATPAAG